MPTEFPSLLNEVPADERVPEAFGWMPLLVGGSLLGQFPYIATTTPPEDLLAISAGLAVLGALLVVFEFYRRPQRTVFVTRGSLVGIYRRGKFSQAVARQQIQVYLLSWWNTLMYLFFPVTFGPTLLFFCIFPPARNVSVEEWDAWLVIGLVMVAAAASLIRTRILCRHFYVPKGHGQEEVLIPHGQVARAFPWLQ